MSARRSPDLDALERRLTGPKRIALFGHRAVGKTTLLAMFYREASAGGVPGIRLAAVGARGAEYLADKIARIEAGEPPAGTLTETDLELRLYRGPARIDLIVKDYQGEHVALGSDASILEFFADCDAVLLCLEAVGSDDPAERRRRQQEVEHLLERYIGASDDTMVGRPVALLLTKYDRVLAAGGPPPDRAEEIVEARFGMTRHALASHAPRSAVFAVSSYGTNAPADGSPPDHLEPMGLDGPLLWLVEQVEATDRELLEWIWDLSPKDAGRLGRCVSAFRKRYPNSPKLIEYRRRLRALRRRSVIRGAFRAIGALVALVAGLAVYDAAGFYLASNYERQGHPPPEVARRWEEFLAWHPTQPLFWPDESRIARTRRDEARVASAKLRAEVGTVEPDELRGELAALKETAPDHLPAIEEAESAIRRREAERRWQEIRAEALLPSKPAEDRLEMIQQFLRDDPDTPFADQAVELASLIRKELDEQTARRDREVVDAWLVDARLPDPDYLDLIERARTFLEARPDSPRAEEVRGLIDDWLERLDRRDFDRAVAFEEASPQHGFEEQIRRYRDYLHDHAEGGLYVEQAKAAISRIERRRDDYLYRQAFDHWSSHPGDLAEVARRLRDYLSSNPEGQYAAAARSFLARWEEITRPNTYRVTLVRGKVDPSLTKTFSGGGPDLGVVLYVAGEKHGPSPVIPNSTEPVWNYTFPRPIRWKYGDDVVIQLIDNDWSDSTVATLRSGDDPLAMRVLDGTVRPSRSKGKVLLEFRSDFELPRLPPPRQYEKDEGTAGG
ncbi:TRAFAC clade GTPase domain-containing protein [Tautonia sociabilis]|uniref:Double-GTPase 2 domain-containing protein n=1 Tax=Tautonia sociabilis TaxID=2080755 RepID=A0A432MMZ8_9BACT|nr:C2 domain-containing protein [Tautonia sociabilis]RUL88486.1 hypothetical protein TsocGM_07170 [Tautonia sociabilis]